MSVLSFNNVLCVFIAIFVVVLVFRKNKQNHQINHIAYSELQKAIEAHALWKHRFTGLMTGVISGSVALHDTKTFDRELVEQDDQCPLGKWLHGTGMEKLRTTPEFIDLVDTHRCFHQYAGQMIDLMREGKHKEVAYQLSKQGEFEQNSEKLSRQLFRLYRGSNAP